MCRPVGIVVAGKTLGEKAGWVDTGCSEVDKTVGKSVSTGVGVSEEMVGSVVTGTPLGMEVGWVDTGCNVVGETVGELVSTGVGFTVGAVVLAVGVGFDAFAC